jgi:hypothetical protein
MSSELLYDDRIYYSYGQICASDEALEPASTIMWTKDQNAQGFSRGHFEVDFATLYDFGWAQFQVFKGPFRKLRPYHRAILTSIHVPSAVLYVNGPDEGYDFRPFKLEAGHYEIACAQESLGGGDDHSPEGILLIHMFLTKIAGPLSKSHILIADERLHPPEPLIEILER